MKLKAVLFSILATITSGNSFAAVSNRCQNAIQTEIQGEVRRFTYCENKLDPSTCGVLGERGWYTVSDLKMKKKSLYRGSVVRGILAIGSGTVAGAGALAAPATGGTSLLIVATFGTASGMSIGLMTKSLDEANALSFVLGGSQPKCSLLTKTAQSLESALNQIR